MRLIRLSLVHICTPFVAPTALAALRVTHEIIECDVGTSLTVPDIRATSNPNGQGRSLTFCLHTRPDVLRFSVAILAIPQNHLA